jgi:NAD(P)-dependent dehydrogenase (short-subunit alcohol dehydrogenase family)
MRFEGKTAIVTGASQGIGFAIAEGLAAEGARVVLVARRDDHLTEAVAKIGANATYVVGDVADEDTARHTVAHAVDRHGGVDLLVSNAGTLIPGLIGQQSLDEVDRMIAVNLRGPIAFTHHAAPAMAGRTGAAMVVVSSATGRLPVAGLGVYGATKAALHYLVATWARELAPTQIRVNGICPGGTYTPALHAAAKVIPGLEQATIATNLIKRIASPQEIAGPVLTLLDSTASGYVTGSIWDIDGGYRADNTSR